MPTTNRNKRTAFSPAGERSAASRVPSRDGAGRRGERGFTLLETVIAMIIMMTVGLGASALFLYSVSNNTAATSRTQAYAVAQRNMERLRSVPYTDPLLDPTVAPVCSTSNTQSANGADTSGTSYQFTVCRTVAAQNNVTVNGVTRPTTKLVTLTVTPFLNNAPWAAGAVTITTVRATAQHGPF